MMRYTSITVLALVVIAGCSAENNETEAAKKLTRAELMDPQSCAECHPNHVREWSGSMHAYAAEDPVFRALNARGQRDTDGELGDFCVQCHAPMAVREGLTTDGLNLAEVPQEYKGVTCYFCHTINGIEDDHNAEVTLAGGIAMRGGIANPVANDAHPSKYSVLHDRNDLESAKLCGSCHDIITPKGVHLERTFAEWQETLFAEVASAMEDSPNPDPTPRVPGLSLKRVKLAKAPARREAEVAAD